MAQMSETMNEEYKHRRIEKEMSEDKKDVPVINSQELGRCIDKTGKISDEKTSIRAKRRVKSDRVEKWIVWRSKRGFILKMSLLQMAKRTIVSMKPDEITLATVIVMAEVIPWWILRHAIVLLVLMFHAWIDIYLWSAEKQKRYEQLKNQSEEKKWYQSLNVKLRGVVECTSEMGTMIYDEIRTRSIYPAAPTKQELEKNKCGLSYTGVVVEKLSECMRNIGRCSLDGKVSSDIREKTSSSESIQRSATEKRVNSVSDDWYDTTIARLPWGVVSHPQGSAPRDGKPSLLGRQIKVLLVISVMRCLTTMVSRICCMIVQIAVMYVVTSMLIS